MSSESTLGGSPNLSERSGFDEMGEVTASQKDAVLKANNLPGDRRAEADSILRQAFNLEDNEPCDSTHNPRVALAQKTLYKEIEANPGAYRDYQKTAEFVFVGEIMALRDKMNQPFITGEIPDVSLDDWLAQGRAEQQAIIERYGEALGLDRIRLVINDPIGNERNDELAAKLSWQGRRKPILAMTKKEIEDQYASGSRVRPLLRSWILAR